MSCAAALAALVASTLTGAAARAQTFVVRRTADDSEALSGRLSDKKVDPATSIEVRMADFTQLQEPGTYYVDVPGIGKSVPFRIGTDVYDGELATVMAGFYGWRSGIKVSFEHHGVRFEHEAGHLADALLDYVDGQKGITKDGTGGWYDAGDYGKYLPTASESVVTMLDAWELFHDRLAGLELPYLPEHGGPIPDYLAEVKWELDWMLKMVYGDGTGRVHHKINSPDFPDFILPAQDPTTRYFSTFSTAATAEFVATMARAARVFATYDEATGNYSHKLLEAARVSYAYLKANPADVQYNSSELKAGSYIKKDPDDRMWAAAELWETTGDADVLADFESRIHLDASPPLSFVPNPDWDTTADFALLPYTMSKRPGRNPDLATLSASRLDYAAKVIRDYHDDSGYGRGYDNFYWGSNGIVARTCLLLQNAYVLNPDSSYLDVCADQIGYLYGRNQYNRSQVTGAGIAPPLHIHHRPSAGDDVADPYPGLLVGGGQKATDWKDEQSNFNTNEVAVNWNSALVFALAGFIQGKGATASFGVGPLPAADCGVRINSIGYLPERSKVATVQTECELKTTTAFPCSMGPTTMSGDTSGPKSVIEDAEDGDNQILKTSGRQGKWYVFDDQSGTRSDVEMKEQEGAHGQRAVCMRASGFSSWGGSFGFALSAPDDNRQTYDASAYTGLTFWARGSSSSDLRILVSDKFSDPAGNLCSSCYDTFHFTFRPSEDWKEYTFPWRNAVQFGFGDPQPSVCAAALYSVQFQWQKDADFDLCLDDLAFTTAKAGDDAGAGADDSTQAKAGDRGNAGNRREDDRNGANAGHGGEAGTGDRGANGGDAGNAGSKGGTAGGDSPSDDTDEPPHRTGCNCWVGLPPRRTAERGAREDRLGVLGAGEGPIGQAFRAAVGLMMSLALTARRRGRRTGVGGRSHAGVQTDTA